MSRPRKSNVYILYKSSSRLASEDCGIDKLTNNSDISFSNQILMDMSLAHRHHALGPNVRQRMLAFGDK